MSFQAHRIHAFLGVGLVLAMAGCADPASPPDAVRADAAKPGIFGTYVLDPARSEDYDLTDPCGAPVSSKLVLEGGRWSAEDQWAPGCREGGDANAPVTYRRQGRLEIRGDTIQLFPANAAYDDPDAESGEISDGTVTVYGHCGGMDVYVRQPPRPSPARARP